MFHTLCQWYESKKCKCCRDPRHCDGHDPPCKVPFSAVQAPGNGVIGNSAIDSGFIGWLAGVFEANHLIIRQHDSSSNPVTTHVKQVHGHFDEHTCMLFLTHLFAAWPEAGTFCETIRGFVLIISLQQSIDLLSNEGVFCLVEYSLSHIDICHRKHIDIGNPDTTSEEQFF